MKLLVIDNDETIRLDLQKRIEEAGRQTSIRGLSTHTVDIKNAGSEVPDLIFLGLSSRDKFGDTIKRLHAIFPRTTIALLLPSDIYLEHSVDLVRRSNCRVIASGDLPQIAQLILEVKSARVSKGASANSGRVISVGHVFGGVGATSIATGLASYYSALDEGVALVDFNHVSQTITRWSTFSLEGKVALEKALNQEMPSTELIHTCMQPLGNEFTSKFSILGQPETYISCFKMFLNRDGDFSRNDWIERVLTVLSEEYHIVIVDLGNHWGPALLSALATSTDVILVSEKSNSSIIQSLDFLHKISQESSDPAEFDFKKWNLVSNDSDQAKDPLELSRQAMGIMTSVMGSYEFTSLPFTKKGTNWEDSKSTISESGDKAFKQAFIEMAEKIHPSS